MNFLGRAHKLEIQLLLLSSADIVPRRFYYAMYIIYHKLCCNPKLKLDWIGDNFFWYHHWVDGWMDGFLRCHSLTARVRFRPR